MKKIIIYREDGEKKRREFAVKGYRNSSGLTIKEEPYADVRKFIGEVDYLMSYYV